MRTHGRLAAFLVLALALFAPLAAAAQSIDEREQAAHADMLAADFDSAFAKYSELFREDPKGPLADLWFFRALEASSWAGPKLGAAADKLFEDAGRDGNAVVKAQAEWTAAVRAMKKGDVETAASKTKALCAVRGWSVTGPFENEGEGGYAEAFGPEKELSGRKGPISLDAEYEGKEGRNKWRVLPVEHPLGMLPLAGLFRTSENVCGYAATYLNSHEACDAALRIGSTGPVKVWVNGALVFQKDAYRPMLLDQDVAPVRFGKGWNEILVKTCHKKGQWNLLVRVTGLDGTPRPDFETTPDPSSAGKGVLAGPAAPPDPAAAFRGAEDVLSKAVVSATPPPVLDLARLAFILRARSSIDENDLRLRDLLRKAVEQAPDSAYLKLMLSAEEADRNSALERCLEARKTTLSSPLVAYSLSRFYGKPKPIGYSWWSFFFGGEEAASTQEEYAKIREVEMPEKELALIEEALAAKPGFLPALRAAADFYWRKAAVSGFEQSEEEEDSINPGAPFAAEARAWLEKILSIAPGDPAAVRRLESLKPVSPEKAAAIARGRLETDFTDAKSRAVVVKRLLSTGSVDEAVGALAERLKINPFDAAACREMAAAYRAFGMLDRAAECLRKALSVAAEDVETMLELADVLLSLDRRDEALAAFKQALAVKPQMADVEKRIGLLAPKEEDFYKPFRADLAPLIEKARSESPADKTPAVVYFKNDVVQVIENGLSRHFHQTVIRILTEKGANDHRYIDSWPGRQDYYAYSRANILTAKLYKADGSVMEGSFYEGSDSASFNNPEPGDVLAFECVTKETGEPRYKNYFGLMLLMQNSFCPVRLSRATFLWNEDRPLHFQAVRVPGAPAESGSGGRRVRTYEISGLPEVKEEFRMPGMFELCPYVHASTFGSWEEVSLWYSNLIRDQLESSAEIKETVAKITAGLSTAEQKVDAIFHFMVSDIRYESLDLSDHAYRPFKARQTFARKYGDCKDTATLVKVMLAEAGIDSHVVLIRAGNAERIDIDLPSMKIFNHAIAFVPSIGGNGLFLDGTARYCGSRELPSMDQGAVTFVVGLDGKGKALIMPYDEPSANLTKTTARVTLAADGSAAVSSRLEVRGQAAYEYRSEFQQGTKREEEMEKRLNAFFKSASVKKISFSDLSDYNRPVEAGIEFDVPMLARFQARTMAIRLALQPSRLCDSLAPTSERYNDLVLGHPWKRETASEIRIPAGWKIKSLPAGKEIDSDAGRFSLAADRSGATVTARISLELKAPRIALKDYPAFRRFCEEVDRAEEEELVLEKE